MIDTLLVALEDSEVVISALADADTHVAALAVTGKGYHRHSASGVLFTDDPAVENDLRGDLPQTIFGYLSGGARRFARRHRCGMACQRTAGRSAGRDTVVGSMTGCSVSARCCWASLRPIGGHLFQEARLDAHLAGTEANVAVAPAKIGEPSAVTTTLPHGSLDNAALEPVRGAGVNLRAYSARMIRCAYTSCRRRAARAVRISSTTASTAASR